MGFMPVKREKEYLQRSNEMILCLCGEHLRPYLEDKEYRVERLNHFQNKDQCTCCEKMGYDYRVNAYNAEATISQGGELMNPAMKLAGAPEPEPVRHNIYQLMLREYPDVISDNFVVIRLYSLVWRGNLSTTGTSKLLTLRSPQPASTLVRKETMANFV